MPLFRVTVAWEINNEQVVRVYEARSPQQAWQAAVLEKIGIESSPPTTENDGNTADSAAVKVDENLTDDKNDKNDGHDIDEKEKEERKKEKEKELEKERELIKLKIKEERDKERDALYEDEDDEERQLRAEIRDQRRSFFRALRVEQRYIFPSSFIAVIMLSILSSSSPVYKPHCFSPYFLLSSTLSPTLSFHCYTLSNLTLILILLFFHLLLLHLTPPSSYPPLPSSNTPSFSPPVSVSKPQSSLACH